MQSVAEASGDDDGNQIEIVARVRDLGPTALCAFVAVGPVVRAAISARNEREALEHIRRHLALGPLDGVRLCGLDCTGSAEGAPVVL